MDVAGVHVDGGDQTGRIGARDMSFETAPVNRAVIQKWQQGGGHAGDAAARAEKTDGIQWHVCHQSSLVYIGRPENSLCHQATGARQETWGPKNGPLCCCFDFFFLPPPLWFAPEGRGHES